MEMNANDLSKEALFELVTSYKNIIEKQADRIKELETKYKQEFDYVEYLLKERK
jgi:hypothetical protein